MAHGSVLLIPVLRVNCNHIFLFKKNHHIYFYWQFYVESHQGPIISPGFGELLGWRTSTNPHAGVVASTNSTETEGWKEAPVLGTPQDLPFFSFSFFFCCIHSTWNFLGQGSNSHQSCALHHGCIGNARSLTRCATTELPRPDLLNLLIWLFICIL